MSSLFIANCTKQSHDFLFRRVESQRIISLTIAPGTQVKVLNDAAENEIDHVVHQHTRYGMTDEKSAQKDPRFHGLCYAVDHPVKLENMHLVYAMNDHVLREQAKHNREVTAASISSRLDQNLRDAGSPTRAARVEVQVEDQAKPGQDQQINEGVEVVAEGVAARRARKR